MFYNFEVKPSDMLAELQGRLPIKMKLAPSVFQVGDHFVLVSDLALAKEVLAVHQGTQPGLAGTAAFKRLSTGMELKGQQLQFVSPRAAEMAVGLKQLVPVLLQRSEMPEEGLIFFKSLNGTFKKKICMSKSNQKRGSRCKRGNRVHKKKS